MSSTFTRATHWAVALILMASAHAFAADGVIKSASGDIFVNGAAASQGDEVSSGDTLKTAFGAWMVVEMDDQSVLDVRSDSEVEITSHAYNPASPEKNSQDVSLLDGTLRYASGLIGKNDYDDVAVRAGDYTVGIRGTAFRLVYNRATGSVQVEVTDGRVGIALGEFGVSGADGKPLEMSAGKSYSLKPNEDGSFTLNFANTVLTYEVKDGNLVIRSMVSRRGEFGNAIVAEAAGLRLDGKSISESDGTTYRNVFNQAIVNTDN